MKRKLPSVGRLKQMLEYDPETGHFTRKTSYPGAFQAGDRAGTNSPQRYRSIMIDRVIYLEHKLAWLYVHGVWPEMVDHKSGDGKDNRLENLRLATRLENCQNRKRNDNNKSGFKGVYKAKGRWRAAIKVDRARIDLGYFRTPEQAHAAYVAAAQKYHGEFARAA